MTVFICFHYNSPRSPISMMMRRTAKQSYFTRDSLLSSHVALFNTIFMSSFLPRLNKILYELSYC